jgi:protein SCO1
MRSASAICVAQGLGFSQQEPNEDADITNHAGMLRIGNERMASWGHASAITTGKAVARMIRFELG